MPQFQIIDPGICEYESAAFHGLLHKVSRRVTNESHRRFLKHVSLLPKKNKVYLLCTGPNLKDYRDYDFSDGYVVLCNNAVSDMELMGYTQPDIVVASDPVYHFGPSRGATSYRASLNHAAEKHLFFFLTLTRRYNLARRYIDIPDARMGCVTAHRSAKVDALGGKWGIPLTENILTLLMLPVAFCLANKIYIIGADGRESNESRFWQHMSTPLVPTQGDSFHQCHPAFFCMRNYNEYYRNHCNTVSDQVRSIEKAGGSICSLTPSLIPALAERQPSAATKKR